MLQVGITGGIGSGKTTVASIFSALGIPVFNSDLIARELINTDPKIREQISQIFGKDIYSNQTLDRTKVASIVFSHPSKLQELNQIVHPAVQHAYITWAGEQGDVPYVLKEAAILFESGSYKNLDCMIVVSAPKELRMDRVVQRDGVSASDVLKRMDQQWPEEKRLKHADYIIYNDGQQLVIPQVLDIHQKLKVK